MAKKYISESGLARFKKDSDKAYQPKGEYIPVPSTAGLPGQVLTKTETGTAWSDVSAGESDISEKLIISLVSNQSPDDAALVGTSIVVRDNNDESDYFNGVWDGSDIMVKMPPLANYTITVGAVKGYSHPDPQTYDSKMGYERRAAFYYNACALTVLLVNAYDESQATVNIGGEEQVLVNNGGTVKVPFGKEITVTAPEILNFNNPENNTATFSNSNEKAKTVTFTYAIQYSTIRINQNISDPDTMISGDINGDAIQAIRNNSHGYLGKYTGDGEMTILQLWDTNFQYVISKSGGYTTIGPGAITQGGDYGDVFMRLPRFYTKAEEVEADIWDITFAYGGKIKDDADWKLWDGNDLIGIFEAYSENNKLFSRSSVLPVQGLTHPNAKQYARNRGKGYSLTKLRHHNIMAILFYASKGMTNSRKVSQGNTNQSAINPTAGSMTDLGNQYRWWGLFNWWGHFFEWLDNVECDNWTLHIDNSEEGEPDETIENIPTTDGYISKLVLGKNLNVVVKSLGATSTTGFCDGGDCKSGDGTVPLRSCDVADARAGVAYMTFNQKPSVSNTRFSCRLCFRGKLVIEKDPSIFAKIAITNN